MCGISGWVGFDRDFQRDEPAVREVAWAMTETMACRGPDASGLWLAPHAVLGHRRLAVIDLAGGVQPMTATADGRTVAALTYSGEVYNYRELRTELASRGHRFGTDSDTEVVLRAFLEWGEGLVDRLNGMYAFAVWDTRTEELLLVRDRMGIKPLYYHPTADGVLFGSEPKAILAHPTVSAVVDLDGLRELLSVAKTPEHAVFRGMREVRPGQVVRVGRGGLSTRRYWRLEAVEHTDDLATTVSTVRELLEDIVTRQLISDVPLCSLLSGGLDSSVITALAARALRSAGAGPVRSFAVDFTGYTENFRTDPMRDTPDAPFVHELAEHVAAEHSDVVVSTAELMAPATRAATLRAADLPTPLGDMYTSLYLLFRAIREHSTVALSGESADEVFGGYPWFHQPALADADTFPWLAMLRVAGFDESNLLHPDLRARLDVAGYRDASYRAGLAEVPHLAGASPAERRMREVCYLHLTRFVQLLLDRKDRMSMASGLEVRVPFCDHRLVQYVFNTPWSMKAFDGREKSLLRAATRDLLPASIAERRKSPYPTTQDRGYEVALREEVAKLLVREDSAMAALVDTERARALLAEPASQDSTVWNRGRIEMLLGLDAWLSTYQVTLDLSG
ncbi:MAG TPA: asparagine synthase (glutamine-hydrolyzing) [Mycobacteriales bacterium]|nr:asparagine synthase (glutamine-hydrolyzing) [Mycobacteriales bacterium]